ncbi:MAG: hypothetical protein GOU97_03880 [Nanoarchaeota archaeon]|nr:hypothetical protein [Nanoarchaeota archaeon]
MGTITLSVPDELKSRMDKTDFINWSAVARRAFAETLSDMVRLELMKKVREISGIPENDDREVKKSAVKETVKSIESLSKKLKSGKVKPMTVEELDELMGLK